MSNSILYHTFGIRSVQHCCSDFWRQDGLFRGSAPERPDLSGLPDQSVSLSTVRYLALDEKYLGRKRKFITIAMDLESGRWRQRTI